MLKAKLPAISIVVVFLTAVCLRLAHVWYFFDQDWEMDAFCHVLKIEGCIADMPHSLWNVLEVWSKPLFTAFFAAIMLVLPENIRFLPVIQLFNILFWCTACYLLLRNLETSLREEFGGFAKIAFLLVALFSFVPFRGSVSANTEPIGALIICLSLLYFQKRQYQAACFIVGLGVLARIDVLLMTAVQVGFSAVVMLSDNKKTAEKIRQMMLMGVVGLLPAFIWSVLGYFWDGNFLLIFNSYPTTPGRYGFGQLGWYFDVFYQTDKAFTLLYCLTPLLLLNEKVRKNPLFLLCFIQSAVYFVVMTVLWIKGANSLAGLQRYFIVALPYYLVCIGFVLAQLFAFLRGLPRSVCLALSFSALAMVANILCRDLTLLIRKPVMHSRQWTAIGGYDMYFELQNARELAKGKTIYTDAEGVVYYLRTDRNHPVAFLKLNEIRNPDAKGIFVFVKGWSEHYSHLALQDVMNGGRFVYQQDESIFLFERP